LGLSSDYEDNVKTLDALECKFADAFRLAAGAAVADLECRADGPRSVEIRVVGALETKPRSWFLGSQDVATVAVTIRKRRMRFRLKSSCDLNMNDFVLRYEAEV
jgi:hypothetical protein